MLWLKQCVVPTLSHEVIVTDVVYLAVLLTHRKSITLLPAVMPRFSKYVKIESRRESMMYIREENIPRIHAKPKIT